MLILMRLARFYLCPYNFESKHGAFQEYTLISADLTGKVFIVIFSAT